MGILNITPDSFSDGGRYYRLEHALNRAEQMIAEGVDIIDIGGESSRPGAPSLSLEEELERVLPVLHALKDCGKALSVDTCKPGVMRAALDAGADLINDIRGFSAPNACEAVAGSAAGLCVMHMQNDPQTMQKQPFYADVCAEVTQFLATHVAALEQAGVARTRLCIDPGIGFGKNLDHNLALIRNIQHIRATLNLPMLLGVSRKSMLGQLTGRAIEDRMAASVAAALFALTQNVDIVRVHDVRETHDAFTVWTALNQ